MRASIGYLMVLQTAVASASTCINATVVGCIHPSSAGDCVGDFVLQLTPRGDKFPLPIDFSTVPLSKTAGVETSSILSSTPAIDGDKTKTLGDYTGFALDVAVFHGQALWPCTLADGGGLAPAFAYNASLNYNIIANFTQDSAAEDIYTCAISPA
jgi:hypothetical protein